MSETVELATIISTSFSSGVIMTLALNNTIEELEFAGIKLRKRNDFVYFESASLTEYKKFKKLVKNYIDALCVDLMDVYTDLFLKALRDTGESVESFTADPRIVRYIEILDGSIQKNVKPTLKKIVFANGFSGPDSESFRRECVIKTKKIYKDSRDHITPKWDFDRYVLRETFIKKYMTSKKNVNEVNERVYCVLKTLIEERNLAFSRILRHFPKYSKDVIDEQWSDIYG